jgi:hypothetical protein
MKVIEINNNHSLLNDIKKEFEEVELYKSDKKISHKII